MYPLRVRRTQTDLDYQKRLDNIRAKVVEWRKTFAPAAKEEAAVYFSDPVLLDEFYCRDILKAIPGIVERTTRLSRLTLSGLSKSEFVCLREAATCYLFGLLAAAVALARTAVEDALRRKLAKFYGKPDVANATLNEMLDKAAQRKTLSRKGLSLAHEVRLAAKRVLHPELGPGPRVEPDALAVLEAAKAVIFELSRHSIDRRHTYLLADDR